MLALVKTFFMKDVIKKAFWPADIEHRKNILQITASHITGEHFIITLLLGKHLPIELGVQFCICDRYQLPFHFGV